MLFACSWAVSFAANPEPGATIVTFTPVAASNGSTKFFCVAALNAPPQLARIISRPFRAPLLSNAGISEAPPDFPPCATAMVLKPATHHVNARAAKKAGKYRSIRDGARFSMSFPSLLERSATRRIAVFHGRRDDAGRSGPLSRPSWLAEAIARH